ncbi:hypothetical protein [Fodinibius salsisoli]|uniref:Uncharacterized protein n=1 Tax=Fodinibius salsisoli TaxID=2820877 RepID=A0ABT3PPN8_9BACT|nr:hypothetical protein [Fodinibius salsisoli]MCW9707823.1 hypothetical protein [Fodinibius salsisoli]
MKFKERFRFFFNLDYHYAFLQVILMVISILIAFWVDTWWQGKQNIKKEKAYLSALKSELEENQRIYDSHMEKLKEDVSTTSNFLSMLKGNTSGQIPADSLQKYIWPLATINVITPIQAALDDLINSGGMQYIRSDILRRQIATYKQNFEFDFEKQRSALKLWNSTLSVFNLNNMNISQVVPADAIESSSEIPKFAFNSSFSASDRRTYINRLVQRILLIDSLQESHRKVLQNIRPLLFQLNYQLNSEASPNSQNL